jgi:hypothetical protein
MKPRIVAYSFMILLLAAHFVRSGSPLLMVGVLLFPFLFFIKRHWVIQILQIVAYAGALIWMFTAYEYIIIRISEGHNWFRLMLILFAVATYTAWTGYLLNSEKVKAIYRATGENESEPNTQ